MPGLGSCNGNFLIDLSALVRSRKVRTSAPLRRGMEEGGVPDDVITQGYKLINTPRPKIREFRPGITLPQFSDPSTVSFVRDERAAGAGAAHAISQTVIEV